MPVSRGISHRLQAGLLTQRLPSFLPFPQNMVLQWFVCISGGKYSEEGLPYYSDGFVQDLHLIPFSPVLGDIPNFPAPAVFIRFLQSILLP